MSATLKVGQEAPQFKLLDSNGNEFNLADNKSVILYFYPKDSTAGCTSEACSLRDGYQELRDKGFEVVGVSGDSAASHNRFIEKQQLPFRLLVDAEKSLCELYGAYGLKKMCGREYMGIIRKTFVIEGGVITHIIEKVQTKAHAEQILNLLNQDK